MALNLEADNVPSALNKLLHSVKEIQENKRNRKAASSAYNWETESDKLLQLWKKKSA